jgi:hypothetical protein
MVEELAFFFLCFVCFLGECSLIPAFTIPLFNDCSKNIP